MTSSGIRATIRKDELDVRTSRTSRLGPDAKDQASGNEKAMDTGPPAGAGTPQLVEDLARFE